MKKLSFIFTVLIFGCFLQVNSETTTLISENISINKILNNLSKCCTNAKIDLSRYKDNIYTIKTGSFIAEFEYVGDKIKCKYNHVDCDVLNLHKRIVAGKEM